MEKLIVANWKMNKTVSEAISLVKELKRLALNMKGVEVVICPPFTSIHAVAKEFEGSNVKLGAQNMHFEGSGAFTGEISPLMLKDFKCDYVILGHSERRELFGENDILINKKVISALNHGMMPILCIGEDFEQRKKGKTNEVIESQLKKCLNEINKKQILNVSIAYEPLWAISKGNPNHKAASSTDAEEAHKFIRSIISDIFDEHTSKNIKVIYGGSVKPENAKELFSMPNIDGGLVGNASLNANSFFEIVKSAK